MMAGMAAVRNPLSLFKRAALNMLSPKWKSRQGNILRAFYVRPSNQIRGRLLKCRFRCITCLFAAKSIGEKSQLRNRITIGDGLCLELSCFDVRALGGERNGHRFDRAEVNSS